MVTLCVVGAPGCQSGVPITCVPFPFSRHITSWRFHVPDCLRVWLNRSEGELTGHLPGRAVSATGCFGFPPRKPTPANLNKEGM